MAEWHKYLSVGDIIILGVMYISLWFVYKNFLRKVLESIDKKMGKEDCFTLRVGCQEVMSDKRKSGVETSDVKFEAIAEKLDVIHKQLTHMIQRIDAHINGGHK